MPNDEWTFVQRKKYSRGNQISVDNYSCQSTVFSSQGSRGSGSLCSAKSVVDPKHPKGPKAPINNSPSPSPTSPSPQNKTRQQPLPPVSAPIAAPSLPSPAVLQPVATPMGQRTTTLHGPAQAAPPQPLLGPRSANGAAPPLSQASQLGFDVASSNAVFSDPPLPSEYASFVPLPSGASDDVSKVSPPHAHTFRGRGEGQSVEFREGYPQKKAFLGGGNCEFRGGEHSYTSGHWYPPMISQKGGYIQKKIGRPYPPMIWERGGTFKKIGRPYPPCNFSKGGFCPNK